MGQTTALGFTEKKTKAQTGSVFLDMTQVISVQPLKPALKPASKPGRVSVFLFHFFQWFSTGDAHLKYLGYFLEDCG